MLTTRILGPLLAALIAAAAPAAAATAAPAPFRFGSYVATLGGGAPGALEDLNEPTAAAIARDGRLYVVDRNNHRVVVFALVEGSWTPVSSFGRYGEAPGELRFPEAVAVGRDGMVYVADTGNHRVQVFDAQGGFVRQWGERGSRRDQFSHPTGIAVDPTWVFVADSGNNRIQVFERDGRFVTSIGDPDVVPQGFHRPLDVAVDDGNTVVVADTDANRICVFNKAGRLLRSWGGFGAFAGLLDQPQGVAISPATGGGGPSEVLVCDTRNHRIQAFDGGGALTREWGAHARMPREGEGRLHYPRRVAIAPDGAFAVICEPFEDRCQIFAALPEGAAETPRQVIPPDEQTHFGKHLALDGALLAIAEPEIGVVDVFDLRGETPILITRLGQHGQRFGQFLRLSGVAVDASERRVLASDPALGRIQTFSLDYDPNAPIRQDPLMGRFVRSMETSVDAGPFRALVRPGWPMRADGIKRDARGRTHVVDGRNRMVFVYDQDMTPLLSYGGAAAGPGELLEPTDTATSRAGDLFYVVDAGRREVVVFDRRGTPVGVIGSRPGAPPLFVRPFGIAGGRDGYLYVTDEGGHRVLKFSEDGRLVADWGTKGVGDGEFWKPTGIAQDASGRVVVIDTGNHRAQVFEPDGTWHSTFGGGQARLRGQPKPALPTPASKED